jgi:pimeloyl-ACP methyl ester carboxylesterase
MKPFTVEWSEDQIHQVLERVRTTPLPPAPVGSGWTYGCDRDYLARLQQHWVNGYDWRAAMADLNRFPQFIATIDGLDIHFVHVQGESKGRRPLILTHGWPGSHHEFWHLIEPLAFPSRFGGRPEDAFDVVVPSLPGYGFSGKPQGPTRQSTTAALWNKLMTEVLGYKTYLAQGGDWGSIVTSWMGLNHGDAVKAIHLNMMAFRSMTPPQNEAEQQWMQTVQAAQMAYSGYSAVQIFKPQSLAWATAGNPLGQAAWIAERFHDWSDLRERSFDDVHPMDALLTNIMLYVMTDSFATAAWFYPGVALDGFAVLPPGQRCETPTTYANFPGDSLLPSPPRSRMELTYNVQGWTDFPSGGHFAALERPAEFLSSVQEWGRQVWPL